MTFRRTKLSSDQIEQFGRGYHLHLLTGAEVIHFDDHRGILSFSGPTEPCLEIESTDLEWEGVECDLSSLIGRHVVAADAFDDGFLTICFDGDSTLHIPAGPYEAWQLRDVRSLSLVSVAGGGLAVWS